MPTDLFRLYIEQGHLSVDVSVWLVGGLILISLILLVLRYGLTFFDPFSPEVQLQVPLGGLGSISIKADYSISQIAFTAWTELITRKAGLPIDLDKDVIVDVYRSWYQLFGIMRELIKTIPAPNLKKRNTRRLIRVLVDTLNLGLRPHLTTWQAKFNRWYEHEAAKPENAGKSPQEVQRQYPEYEALAADLLELNRQLVSYASELRRLIRLNLNDEHAT